MFFAAGPLEAAVTNKALNFPIPKDRERMIGYGTYEGVMDVIEAAVKKSEYIAGDDFTAADVYVGSQIGFGLVFGTIEKRPAFERYWERLSQRPALSRAKDIDDALVPKATG